jgi:predicted transcriptional regulator
MQDPAAILARIGLADSEIAAYTAMLRGARSARDIMKVTRQKRPTTYYAIARLEERGLVRDTGRSGTRRYEPEPPERLSTIVATQKKELDALAADVAELIPSLAVKEAKKNERPHVAFYEGVEAVKGIIMETLYCRDRHIDSIAPKDNFFWQVAKGFADAYVGERSLRKIRTRNLWEAPINTQLMKKYYVRLSEIRLLPAAVQGKFATTVFLYDDKTLYISSLPNAYALLVTSREHHDTLQAFFDGLWTGSTVPTA